MVSIARFNNNVQRVGTMPLHARQTLLGIAAAVMLAGCASSPQPTTLRGTSARSPNDILNLGTAAASANSADLRDLSPEEKRVIMDAVATAVRDPATAKYKWARIPRSAGGSNNYCAMVNAKSQYPAYNGWQAYIVELGSSGGTVTSAVVGAIAGGNDIPVIKRMCKRYGLDPSNAV
jgi:hypothetical protein